MKTSPVDYSLRSGETQVSWIARTDDKAAKLRERAVALDIARAPKLTPEQLAAKMARGRTARKVPGGRVSRERSRTGSRRAAISRSHKGA